MVTRRTAIGAGLACISVACSAAVGAYARTTRRPSEAQSIDALLIDESIEMSQFMAAFIDNNRHAVSVIGIQLDAPGQAGLIRVLAKSRTIIGVSSGATLFCLERIAWDHGFRLTARSQQCAGATGENACRQEMAAYMTGAQSLPLGSTLLTQAYRPSRADGLLHAWVMQRSRPQFRHSRREI